ncbi:hypothetical protein FQN54_008192 [Arachnomyces sp. PD_36]|nr:hypothetical protein FQN54_008192 [Arachnomyces sp. PD_36]
MYRTSPWQRRDFLKTYKAKLAGWKEDVACQCQSEPPRCTCKNYFMRMDKIVEWMEQRQDGEDVTNLDGLLRELKDKIKSLNTYDPFSSSDHLLKGDNRCVTVFAILLELGHGELIYTFKFMNVIDKLLELAPNSNLTELRRDLIQRNIPNASKIIDEFQDAKWAYYSPSLKLSMERNIDSKSVLPFCRRERVNGKGGTASVFEVRVKEEFISDPGLAKALSKSRCIDPVFGQVVSTF